MARHEWLLVVALVALFAGGSAHSQQVPQAEKAAAVQQEDKTSGDASKRASPEQPATPARVTIDGQVTVVNQPDPNQQQRDAEQKAQTHFNNRVDIATLILLALAALAAIGAYLANRRAAAAASQQVKIATSARVYVDGVEAVNFKAGEEPVFLLRIFNAGPVPAENVGVFIKVTYIYGSTEPLQANTITIPANDFRRYDFRTFFKLPTDLAALEKWNLTLTGTVTYNGSEIPLCYKYNYWHSGVRPAEVPQFVPCDFDDRRNITLVAQLGGVSATASTGTLTAKSEDPEAADGGKTDESKPNSEP